MQQQELKKKLNMLRESAFNRGFLYALESLEEMLKEVQEKDSDAIHIKAVLKTIEEMKKW